MLRIVPDVNVLVSGVLTPSGLPGRIMAAWRQNQIAFVVSLAIIEKTVEVLRRPHILNAFSIEESDIQDLRTFLTEEAVITPGTLDLQVVKEDPEDDTILIAAVEGKADCIVSGDRHLKNLGSYQNIPILSPSEFMSQYKITE